MARKKIKPGVRRDVLTEAGYRCAVPTCRNVLAIDLHHLVEVKDGGGNEPGNLLALCPTCHALFHRGTIDREALYSWKLVLVALTSAFDVQTIDDLLFVSRIGSIGDQLGEAEAQKAEESGQPAELTLVETLQVAHDTAGGLVLSGDGVLRFARLIGAGLAEFRVLYGMANTGELRYEVLLTDRGRMLVDAWRSGRRELVQEALGSEDRLE